MRWETDRGKCVNIHSGGGGSTKTNASTLMMGKPEETLRDERDKTKMCIVTRKMRCTSSTNEDNEGNADATSSFGQGHKKKQDCMQMCSSVITMRGISAALLMQDVDGIMHNAGV